MIKMMIYVAKLNGEKKTGFPLFLVKLFVYVLQSFILWTVISLSQVN